MRKRKEYQEGIKMCDFCEEKTEKVDVVYKLSWITNKGSFNIGLKTLFSELSDFLFNKGSHLSASQIILLRPDIVKEFLQSKKCKLSEKLIDFFLSEFQICENCYEEYIKLVPLL